MGCTASRYHHTSGAAPPPPPPPPPLQPIITTPTATAPPFVVVHHPAVRQGDSHHIVFLTSTTYGYSLLPPVDHPQSPPPPPASPPLEEHREASSPTTVINAWELMDGLDDPASAAHYHPDSIKKPSFFSKSHTFHHHPPAKENPKNTNNSPPPPAAAAKPLWKHLSEESLLADLDPSVASYLRRSSTFNSSKPPTAQAAPPKSAAAATATATATAKIVLYTTSLRGIRRTYEDCRTVRNILRGFRVAVDERDVSMDSSYRKELQGLVGGKSPIALPQLFVWGRRVGGAEEVRQMHESGEMERLLEGAPLQDPCFVCRTCGNVRFVPCGNCNGSRKVFAEEEEELRRCSSCNENGLVRCPDC